MAHFKAKIYTLPVSRMPNIGTYLKEMGVGGGVQAVFVTKKQKVPG